MTHRIPPLRSDCHLPHAFGGVREIANIETAGRIVMISKLYGCGIEIEVLRRDSLLPCLQAGHGVIAELISESADRVGRVVECKRRIVVVVVYDQPSQRDRYFRVIHYWN